MPAECCKDYKNYNSMFAIMSGLRHGSVSRLRSTWEKLPNKYCKMFEVSPPCSHCCPCCWCSLPQLQPCWPQDVGMLHYVACLLLVCYTALLVCCWCVTLHCLSVVGVLHCTACLLLVCYTALLVCCWRVTLHCLSVVGVLHYTACLLLVC